MTSNLENIDLDNDNSDISNNINDDDDDNNSIISNNSINDNDDLLVDLNQMNDIVDDNLDDNLDDNDIEDDDTNQEDIDEQLNNTLNENKLDINNIKSITNDAKKLLKLKKYNYNIELIGDDRISKPYFTNYEICRIVSIRINQLSNGMITEIDDTGLNIKQIVKKEFLEKKIPLYIKRELCNNYYEIWKFNELKMKKQYYNLLEIL